MNDAAPMVRLMACSKKYDDVVALEHVDLEIARGEFVTLLGPSGSGKTTILNLIAGMVGPTSGRVLIAGSDVTDQPVHKRGLGMVFQNYALMPHMTIFENVAFPLRVRKLSKAEIDRRVGEVLELVHLPQVSKRKPRELSGGQQQRVALARAIVYNPSLILMDEPLGALDRKLREQMQLEIKRLHVELGITMLYVTHDQEEALTMSDRIVLLSGGRIAQVGDADDLYFHPRSVFAAEFLGDSNLLRATVLDDGDGKVMRLATAAGVTLTARPRLAPPRGVPVCAMVRPENISVLRPGEQPAHDNVLTGTVIDSILLGGVVKHYVRVSDEVTMVAQELNLAVGRGGVSRGTTVQLGVRPEDIAVLPEDGPLSEG